MLARFGSSISKWQDAQSLGNARGDVQRDGSARQSVHSENPLCCLQRETSVAVHGHVGRQGFSNDSQRWLPKTWRPWGNSYLVDVEFKGGLLECEKTMMRGPPSLVGPVDSGVAGLSATAGVDERRAVTISTPEMPSREAVESHQLTHIPFARWCRACISGRGREAPHFRHGGGEDTGAATPAVSLDYFFLGLTDSTGEGTTPTLVLCDGNTTYSLGFMVPRKCPVPHAVRGVCVFLQVGSHANDLQK